ncbi:MAG: glycosyltransferase family 4 protein [Anaerolineales bacterium]|nr:glycosyltransferase family 4 protein [Anaerolineales bacterium]
MHLLLIHQALAAPNQPGGTRHYELGQHLIARGHAMTVVTSDLNYMTGQAVASRKGVFVREDLDGIALLRAYTYPALHRSFVWRVVSFLSFMVSSLWAGLNAGPVDVVMGTTPPIFQAVTAWLVAALRRKPFLLEVRDLWPEFAIDMGVLRNPVLIRLSRWLESFLYSQADHLLVNSPAYRDYLLHRGIPVAKVSMIPNGVEPGMFHPAERGTALRRQWGVEDKFVVMYAGAMGIANDLSTLLRAANRLRDHVEIQFVIVGDGKERGNLQQEAQALQLPNVLFAGSLPKAQMPEALAAADACVAILQNIPMFRTTYPNKVFDYMAAGRPTLLAIDGVIRRVVEDAVGGFFVPPGDDATLAEATLVLASNPELAHVMGENASTYVRKHFDRGVQADEFVALVTRLSAG